MTVDGPYIAERNGTLALWGNGSLQSSVELRSGRVVITVTARGTTVDGEPPRLRVALGTREVGTIDIDSTVLWNYALTADVEKDGMTTVKFSFENFLLKSPPILSRYVFIENVSLQQPG
jgi:hypothetical protein